jgi:hypothetical protein
VTLAAGNSTEGGLLVPFIQFTPKRQETALFSGVFAKFGEFERREIESRSSRKTRQAG